MNIGDGKKLPMPLMNIINGGIHANNSLRIQGMDAHLLEPLALVI